MNNTHTELDDIAIQTWMDQPRDIYCIKFRQIRDGVKFGFQLRFTREELMQHMAQLRPGQRYPRAKIDQQLYKE